MDREQERLSEGSGVVQGYLKLYERVSFSAAETMFLADRDNQFDTEPTSSRKHSRISRREGRKKFGSKLSLGSVQASTKVLEPLAGIL